MIWTVLTCRKAHTNLSNMEWESFGAVGEWHWAHTGRIEALIEIHSRSNHCDTLWPFFLLMLR